MADKPRNIVKAVFFSEFHPQAGPIVSYQTPENFISRDLYDVVSVYVIPKPALYGKIMKVNVLEHSMVGCPNCITDKKYERNALIFNIVFVFDTKCDTQPFEPVVKKLCKYFLDAELDSCFLSDEASRARIPGMLREIKDGLNTFGGVCVAIDTAHSIYLTTLQQLNDPPAVADHHVPIFVNHVEDAPNFSWDLMVQQVLPHINGYTHIARIAYKANVDIVLVRLCIQHLVYFGVVKLIPIFQYSNVYLATPKLSTLLTDNDLQAKCIKFITKPDDREPAIATVFSVCAGLGPGVTVRDLCIRLNVRRYGIDERALIQFCVLHGLLRRLHKYPTLLAEHSDHEPWMVHLMTGQLCEDEICCLTGCSNPELDAMLEEDHHIAVCWK
ncbi:GATOR1 complex protein NPRL2-like isoform X2 [Sycon ciliatum]|uniref:GATOR1 complex protein NPRL2-like isoform X2 n=1 Tax=Sycon ciliatum TaxID=27933 RepID=UPI0031F680A1